MHSTQCSWRATVFLLSTTGLQIFNLMMLRKAERSKQPTLLIETVGTERKCSAQEFFVSQIEKCLKFPATLVFLGGMHYYEVSGKTTEGNNRCLFGHKY